MEDLTTFQLSFLYYRFIIGLTLLRLEHDCQEFPGLPAVSFMIKRKECLKDKLNILVRLACMASPVLKYLIKLVKVVQPITVSRGLICSPRAKEKQVSLRR